MTPEEARDRLEALRAELRSAAEEGADAAATVKLDQTKVGRLSRMDAMQAQAMAQAAQRQRMETLRRIELALKRLDKGDYGYCTACDEDIDPRRLEVDPAAELCITCAEQSTAT